MAESNNSNDILNLKEQINKLEKENIEYSKKLKKIENQSNTFFNLSINLQIIADTSGNIIKISNNCKDILGYSEDELYSISFLELVHPNDREDTINEMKALEKGNIVHYFENRYQHKEGHYIVLGWSASTNHNHTLIYASAHNVTKLKKNEQLVLQQSKLASMGEMLQNIAHQWRQPLSIISSLASGLEVKNDLDMTDKEEIKESMNKINLNVQHLSTTIDTFRSFYKSNKITKKFKIKDAFDKTFKLSSSHFHKAEIIIIEDIDDTIIYNGLENELIQVIMNLINNARDELIRTEDTRLLFITSSIENDRIKINITDNAGGIPADILPKVFDAHFTTKNDKEGTGIGLYMSRTIIEEHMNGTLSVKNVEFIHENITYSGARFSILLPTI